jgi:hypothetical protein
MSVNYSSTSGRADTVLAPGSRIAQLGFTFQPTSKWSASWNTDFDFATERFGQHTLRLERDLRRWQATFSFQKSYNGNFAFSFAISLRDQPEVKFDYDQQSYVP